MAELNFGLLTPPGSQNIGNAFVQGMDQAAVARAQENQNALSQYTLSKARREDEQQNKLYQAVQDPNFKLDVRTALQYGPQGMAALKAQQDAAVAEQTRALNQSQIAERQARLPGYVAEAFDKQMKPFSSAAYNSKNVGEGIASINAMYDNPALASVLTKIKSREQAIESTAAAFNDPKTMAQWQAYWGGITPDKLYTQATVSANTQATLAQNKFQYENPSAYQRSQLEQVRTNHLENLAQQGWTFDTERGIAVNARQGISRPISTLMAPVGGGFSTAPVVGGAPAPSIAAPSIAAPGGGVPGQRQAPAGQPVAGVLGPKPEKLNESQGNATAFGLRMKESEAILEDLAKKRVFRGAMVESIPFVGGAAGKLLPSTLGGTTQQEQQVNQAKNNFITAVLRKESGAVISDSEFEREDNKYFPQLNDKPKVIQQKANARRLAIETMKFQAGPGAKEIDKYVPSINAETLNAPSPSAPPIQSFRRP